VNGLTDLPKKKKNESVPVSVLGGEVGAAGLPSFACSSTATENQSGQSKLFCTCFL
jgi:hypothetical protein